MRDKSQLVKTKLQQKISISKREKLILFDNINVKLKLLIIQQFIHF